MQHALKLYINVNYDNQVARGNNYYILIADLYLRKVYYSLDLFEWEQVQSFYEDHHHFFQMLRLSHLSTYT